MKARTGLLALGLALGYLLPTHGASQVESREPRLITVTGDAEVRVVPDEVILTIGVESWDRYLEAAKKLNDVRVEKVIEVARDHGVEAKHIQTEHISIQPRYDSSYPQLDLDGYFVRKTVVITLRDLSVFDDLLAEIVKAGANYVHGIEFRTTALREHRDQARTLAVTAAREKAEALAGALGQELGEPQSIQEDQVGWWSWYGMGWWGSSWRGGMAQNVVQEVSGDLPTSEEGFAPGQITVNARVTVSFELE